MSSLVISTKHVLAVRDLQLSASYYVDKLGFKKDLAVDGWEFLSLGNFSVMLGECPDEVPASDTNNHSYFAHVLVQDIDSLFDDYKRRGVKFTQEIENKPWGLREFGVVTPDGHRIVFGQDIES